MHYLIAGAFGFFVALAAHDLAAQALQEQDLVPFKGTCPDCGSARGWLRARCPSCDRPVRREGLFVLAAVLGALAFTNTIGLEWSLPAYGGFLLLTLALVATDIDALRIVDRLNLRGTALLVVALAGGAVADGRMDSLWRALLGALAYFVGTNLMFILVRGRGFGYGDVKLSVQLGLFTAYISWGTLGWAVFATAVIGGVLSILVIAAGAIAAARNRRTKEGESSTGMREMLRRELPYGPSMVAGAWLAIYLAGIGAFPVPS